MKCSTKACDTEASVMPVLQLFAPAQHGQHPPAEVIVRMPHCAGCKGKATVEAMVSDEGWEQICGAFVANGLARPARARTLLRWEKLTQGILSAFEKAHQLRN
jgi:hypothetical protein